MNVPHDYAGCENPACQLCQGYRDGFADGMARARDEARERPQQAHASNCGCESCRTLRAVRRAKAENLRERRG